MRKRMLDPEFWIDEEIAQLDPFARLLFQGLWGLCDDNFATFPNRPLWVKAQVFPYDDVDVSECLDALEKLEKIIKFTAADGKEYYWIKNFFKHQTVKKPSKPKYPEYKVGGTSTALVGNQCGTSGELGCPEGKGREGKRREEKREEGKENYSSLTFLHNLSKGVVDKFVVEVDATRGEICEKAKKLALHCESKGKKYSNYYSLLRKVLREDYRVRNRDEMAKLIDDRARLEATKAKIDKESPPSLGKNSNEILSDKNRLSKKLKM